MQPSQAKTTTPATNPTPNQEQSPPDQPINQGEPTKYPSSPHQSKPTNEKAPTTQPIKAITATTESINQPPQLDQSPAEASPNHGLVVPGFR